MTKLIKILGIDIFIKYPLDSNELNNPLLDNMLLIDCIKLFLIVLLINFLISSKIKNKIGIKIINYVPIKYALINSKNVDSFIFRIIWLKPAVFPVPVCTWAKIKNKSYPYLYFSTVIDPI